MRGGSVGGGPGTLLGELRTVFEQYRQDRAAEEISDIDARLSVLEIDLEVERK